MALSDKTRKDWLFLSPHNLGSHRMYKFNGNAKRIPVNSIKFDDFSRKIGKIDIVKIDIEGGEPKCLKGMKRTIKRCGSLSIMIEFHPRMIKENGFNPIRFLNEIRDMGFKMYKIQQYGKLSEIKDFGTLSDVIEKNLHVNLYCRK